MRIKFEGGLQIEQALKELDISSARKRGIARRALDRAAVPIRDEWAGGVDVVNSDFKRSIKIGNRIQTKGTRKFKRSAGQDIVERFIGIDPTEAPAERLEAYSVIEEFGAPNQPANPAGRNAWEAKKMEAFNMIAGEMRAEIEKTAKAEARKTARLAAKASA